MKKIHVDRRQMIRGLVALYGATALSSCSRDATSQEGASSTELHFDDNKRALLRRISDIIIPETATLGAIAAGAPQKIETVLRKWMSEEDREEWLRGLSEVKAALDAAAGSAFMRATQQQQENAVTALDTAAYDGDGKAPEFYRELKQAIATAYYLSERGATEELRYEAIPGDWKSCIPFSEIGRTWAA